MSPELQILINEFLLYIFISVLKDPRAQFKPKMLFIFTFGPCIAALVLLIGSLMAFRV